MLNKLFRYFISIVISSNVFISLFDLEPRVLTISIYIIFIFFGLLFYQNKIKKKYSYDKLYYSYFFVAFLSTLLPGNQSGFEGVAFAFLIGIYPFILIRYFDETNINEELNKLLHLIILSLLIQILYSSFIIGFTELSNRGSGYGEFSPSIIGKNSGILIIIALVYYSHNKSLFSIVCIIIGVLTLLLSFSKSSILSMIFIFLIWFLIAIVKQKRVLVVVLPIFSIIAVVPTFLFDFLDSAWYTYSSNTANVESLTGRVFLWEKIYTYVQSSILFGYGYYSPRHILGYGFIWGDVYVGQAHNMIMHALLATGVIGASLLVGVILKTLLKLFKVVIKKSAVNKSILNYSLLLFLLILFLFIRSFSESSFAQEGSFDVFYLSLAVTYILCINKKVTVENY